ncbi:crossover junction endodeoxyribonuclease RuvC [Desulfobaculum bizertense]|uniref:Crossover junction endodeoxyribonuclease RuvC n=1 Tax=Desulfobaculum bizertense DSM 18034 TaxID=1121442 RepID=A0A1T4VJK2_9BACT|nr:crossover junction endodeoxyribonuclease RuvC [Desulfobaculum bizertense]UIJ37984.1 crossover junction endodeoxyribonuclease RuvC [Desulfobaculum bizertense]SKA65103.1 Holliday junction endonuclease RuvC [Desulfobaculum bizertense DSM 18034]
MGADSKDVCVLGIDPGSRVTGFGIVREVSGCARLVETGTLRMGSEKNLGRRLGKIYEGIAALVEKYQPDEAAIENVFVSKNTMSALKLGQARGAAIAACAVAGLPVSEYEPTKVKQALVGTGRAQKSQVAFMVAQILGVPKPDWAEDASDALGIALCHLNMRRMKRLTGL